MLGFADSFPTPFGRGLAGGGLPRRRRRHNTQTNTEGAGALVIFLAGIGGRELWCSFWRAAGEAQRRYSNAGSEYNTVAERHLRCSLWPLHWPLPLLAPRAKTGAIRVVFGWLMVAGKCTKKIQQRISFSMPVRLWRKLG
jgi:hypothetical protein